MGYNPSRFKGLNLPAENVSWPEADAYFRTLSGQVLLRLFSGASILTLLN